MMERVSTPPAWKASVKAGPSARVDEARWRSNGGSLGEEKIVTQKREEAGKANPEPVNRILWTILILAIFSPIPVYWICSAGAAKQRRAVVEQQWVDDETSGLSGASEDSKRGGEASSGELGRDIETVGRELLQKVVECSEEETKEIATPRFLEDLEQNRAVIKASDLTRLKFEREGRYWVQGQTPYDLPASSEGDSGKSGVAQLRMVFMDGRWKLHELGLSVR